MKQKSWLIVSWLMVVASSAMAAGPSGTDVEYRITQDHFQLTLEQFFPAGTTLEQVKRAYASTTLGPEVSELVTKIERVPRPDGTTEVRTTGKKFGISMTSVNICRIEENSTCFRQYCDFDQTNSINRKLFVDGWGKNNLTCQLDAEGVVACTSYGEARTKGLNVIVKKYSAQEMAATGAKESLLQLGSFYFFVARNMPNGAEARKVFEHSQLKELAERLADDAYGYIPRRGATSILHNLLFLLSGRGIDKGEATGNTLVIQASDRTGAYSVTRI